jgi:hypothetical protein
VATVKKIMKIRDKMLEMREISPAESQTKPEASYACTS